MFTLPNFLSFLRMPLALFFFQENHVYRCMAIILAMLTDGLDGYLARRFQQTSRIGTYLDPITDKLFVFVAVFILLQEQRLVLWQAAALISRDFAIMCFAIYLTVRGHLTEYSVRAIWWGKISTALQFIILIWLVLFHALPDYCYFPFIFFGLLAFRELYLSGKSLRLAGEKRANL